MLNRILEVEVMSDRDEAVAYDSMDHSDVNLRFVMDLIASGPLGEDVLDLGTGTALIPIALCQHQSEVRIMASDYSQEMLELARYRLEIEGVTHRVQLHHGDAKVLIFQRDYFDTVMSNSLVHHLPTHDTFLSETLRVLRPGGLLFVRDLCRPASLEDLELLVESYAAHDSEPARKMFRDSLHAALTVEEMRDLAAHAGLSLECVNKTSDRHWTLSARKPK